MEVSPKPLNICNVYNVNMGIATISVRVPDEVKEGIAAFEEDEKLTQTSEAARKLIMLGLEIWRKDKAVKLLENGKVSFLKAAEIAEMDVWEFAALIKERKTVWIKNKEFLRRDIEAAL